MKSAAAVNDPELACIPDLASELGKFLVQIRVPLSRASLVVRAQLLEPQAP